ncbi:MAG: hypothetical protein HKN85_04250 [Gammaproteobacteria bacterium]|nr:hypothetical protein [Gammaproteobacteria bacterium]
MSSMRTIGISIALVVQPISLLAKNVDEDFQRCAVEALKERGQVATVVSVNSSRLTQDELDHDSSATRSEYHLLLTSKDSGENLGTVICTLDRSGDIIASNFDV